MIASTEDDIPSDPTTIVAPLGNEHSHTVIFLHGREDFGEDLAKYFFDSKSSDGKSLAEIFPSVKWVFPTAGLRYSAQRDFEFSSSSFAEALKGEEIISQWFDMWNINTPDEKQELMIPGLLESMRNIIEMIKEEAQSVPLERIILGGISQGCATAVHTLLSSGLNIGGFIGWCSWLPFQSTIEKLPKSARKNNTKIFKDIQKALQIAKDDESNEKAMTVDKGTVEESESPDITDLGRGMCALSFQQPSSNKTPVFIAHSRDDPLVPFTHGEGLQKTIRNLGFDVTWKDYEDGAHWIHPKLGVDDMSTFLRKIM